MLRPLELLLSHIHHPAPTIIMCMKPSTSLFFFTLVRLVFAIPGRKTRRASNLVDRCAPCALKKKNRAAWLFA
jgi:hypothetical protein